MDFGRICPDHFIGKAKCLRVDSRSAQATTMLLYPDGTVFSEIVISYHVLELSLFERIYKDKLNGHLTSSHNPYIFEPEVSYNVISEKQLFAVIGNVSQTDCAGHFPNLAVVPISILFRILVKLGIILMQNRLNKPDSIFCVRECTTEAKNFAYPGEEIDVNTRFIYTDEKDQHFVKVAAYTHCDCCVGATELILVEVA
jgi:3-hydroxymyristoyl/3-hydroxydecanoyl-(acyl carrier protein) dehydratase